MIVSFVYLICWWALVKSFWVMKIFKLRQHHWLPFVARFRYSTFIAPIYYVKWRNEKNYDIVIPPDRGVENRNQFVCLSVRLSVCLSMSLSVCEHIPGTDGPIFTKFVAWNFFSDLLWSWLGPPLAALRYRGGSNLMFMNALTVV